MSNESNLCIFIDICVNKRYFETIFRLQAVNWECQNHVNRIPLCAQVAKVFGFDIAKEGITYTLMCKQFTSLVFTDILTWITQYELGWLAPQVFKVLHYDIVGLVINELKKKSLDEDLRRTKVSLQDIHDEQRKIIKSMELNKAKLELIAQSFVSEYENVHKGSDLESFLVDSQTDLNEQIADYNKMLQDTKLCSKKSATSSEEDVAGDFSECINPEKVEVDIGALIEIEIDPIKLLQVKRNIDSHLCFIEFNSIRNPVIECLTTLRKQGNYASHMYVLRGYNRAIKPLMDVMWNIYRLDFKDIHIELCEILTRLEQVDLDFYAELAKFTSLYHIIWTKFNNTAKIFEYCTLTTNEFTQIQVLYKSIFDSRNIQLLNWCFTVYPPIKSSKDIRLIYGEDFYNCTDSMWLDEFMKLNPNALQSGESELMTCTSNQFKIFLKYQPQIFMASSTGLINFYRTKIRNKETEFIRLYDQIGFHISFIDQMILASKIRELM